MYQFDSDFDSLSEDSCSKEKASGFIEFLEGYNEAYQENPRVIDADQDVGVEDREQLL